LLSQCRNLLLKVLLTRGIL